MTDQKTPEELTAERDELIRKHGDLHKQIMALMQEQATAHNELTILNMRIAKAKRPGV